MGSVLTANIVFNTVKIVVLRFPEDVDKNYTESFLLMFGKI